MKVNKATTNVAITAAITMGQFSCLTALRRKWEAGFVSDAGWLLTNVSVASRVGAATLVADCT